MMSLITIVIVKTMSLIIVAVIFFILIVFPRSSPDPKSKESPKECQQRSVAKDFGLAASLLSKSFLTLVISILVQLCFHCHSYPYEVILNSSSMILVQEIVKFQWRHIYPFTRALTDWAHCISTVQTPSSYQLHLHPHHRHLDYHCPHPPLVFVIILHAEQ